MFADILRNTPQTSVDYEKLDAAIKEIHNVMTYINEDKKRTEGQVALFDIFNEIEKCPVSWISPATTLHVDVRVRLTLVRCCPGRPGFVSAMFHQPLRGDRTERGSQRQREPVGVVFVLRRHRGKRLVHWSVRSLEFRQ